MDLNGDGNLDLVVADRGDGTAATTQISVLFGIGDGGFDSARNQSSLAGTYMLDAKAAAGGAPSMIVVGGGNSIQLFQVGADSSISDAGVFQSPNATSLFRPVVISDLYNDGGSEAVLGDLYDAEVQVFELDSRAFSSRTWGAASPRGLAVGPLVDAARNDFVATHDGNDAGSSQVYAFEDPVGTNAVRAYPVGTDPKSVTLGDLDGDGLPDIVTCDNNGKDVQIYMNSGGGFFAKGQTIVEASPYQAVVRDMNGDGINDLVVVDQDQTVFGAAIYLGNGDGGFPSSPSFTTMDQSSNRGQQSLDVADFNHDGHPDIAITNLDTNRVTIWMAQ